MAHSKNVGIFGGAVVHLGERWYSCITGELENAGGALNNYCLLALPPQVQAGFFTINVDVCTFQRIDTCSGIHRVLVLIDLDNIVQFVWSILVSDQIIQGQPVVLSALSINNTNSFNIAAGEFAC
jgi:hypothetical protein